MFNRNARLRPSQYDTVVIVQSGVAWEIASRRASVSARFEFEVSYRALRDYLLAGPNV